ncbi:hypothetical protein [Mycolicibacterium aromaticivorans]|nr:hypothetical protein [Mycolicibacterium aromaticivorans]
MNDTTHPRYRRVIRLDAQPLVYPVTAAAGYDGGHTLSAQLS